MIDPFTPDRRLAACALALLTCILAAPSILRAQSPACTVRESPRGTDRATAAWTADSAEARSLAARGRDSIAALRSRAEPRDRGLLAESARWAAEMDRPQLWRNGNTLVGRAGDEFFVAAGGAVTAFSRYAYDVRARGEVRRDPGPLVCVLDNLAESARAVAVHATAEADVRRGVPSRVAAADQAIVWGDHSGDWQLRVDHYRDAWHLARAAVRDSTPRRRTPGVQRVDIPRRSFPLPAPTSGVHSAKVGRSAGRVTIAVHGTPPIPIMSSATGGAVTIGERSFPLRAAGTSGALWSSWLIDIPVAAWDSIPAGAPVSAYVWTGVEIRFSRPPNAPSFGRFHPRTFHYFADVRAHRKAIIDQLRTLDAAGGSTRLDSVYPWLASTDHPALWRDHARLAVPGGEALFHAQARATEVFAGEAARLRRIRHPSARAFHWWMNDLRASTALLAHVAIRAAEADGARSLATEAAQRVFDDLRLAEFVPPQGGELAVLDGYRRVWRLAAGLSHPSAGRTAPVTPPGARAPALCASPAERWRGWVVPRDRESLVLADANGRIRARIEHPAGEGHFALSRDARCAVYSDHGVLYLAELDGTGFVRLTDDGYSGFPALSPNGAEIAFVHTPPRRAGDAELVVMTLDGRNRRVLSRIADGSFGAPVWSPDGRRLAAVRAPARGDRRVLLSIPVDGGATAEIAGEHAGGPAWSPDSRSLAFVLTSSPPGAPVYPLFTVQADGSGRRLLAERASDSAPPAWSPDGEWIAFGTVDGSVERVRADGRGKALPIQNADRPGWSSDGAMLGFWSERLFYTVATSGDAPPVLLLPGPDATNYGKGY